MWEYVYDFWIFKEFNFVVIMLHRFLMDREYGFKIDGGLVIIKEDGWID